MDINQPKRFLVSFVLVALTLLASGQPKQLVHFMQQAPSAPNAIPYGANVKDGHYVTAGNAKIYYEVYGKGQPLVVLHGGIYGSIYEM